MVRAIGILFPLYLCGRVNVPPPGQVGYKRGVVFFCSIIMWLRANIHESINLSVINQLPLGSLQAGRPC